LPRNGSEQLDLAGAGKLISTGTLCMDGFCVLAARLWRPVRSEVEYGVSRDYFVGFEYRELGENFSRLFREMPGRVLRSTIWLLLNICIFNEMGSRNGAEEGT
jgi:hypothetical protein